MSKIKGSIVYGALISIVCGANFVAGYYCGHKAAVQEMTQITHIDFEAGRKLIDGLGKSLHR